MEERNFVEGGLERFILARKGDRSYDDLSRACGGNPSRRRIYQMAGGQPIRSFPDPETIKGLARGLNVAPSEILMAAARSLGIPVGEGNPGALVLHGAGNLPASAQELLISMSQEMQHLYEATTQDEKAATA